MRTMICHDGNAKAFGEHRPLACRSRQPALPRNQDSIFGNNGTLRKFLGTSPSSFRRKVVNGGAAVCYDSAVRATSGTLQEGGASFATTHWSVVAQSALTDVPEAANALAQLCELYWPPIYSFVRRRGYSPQDAQDLTQSFFAYFLRTKAYARTDRLNGKFRSFLLASVKNFLADHWDRNQAIRRGGAYQFVAFDPEKAEAFYDA